MPQVEVWDLAQHLRSDILKAGGFMCCHAHIDKSFVINQELLAVTESHMETKWDTWQAVKRNYTREDLKRRMSLALDRFLEQGCHYVRTFVDVDPTVGLKCVEVAAELRDIYRERGLVLHVVTQVLEGLQSQDSRKYIEQALPYIDGLGALPARDRPHQAQHLDWIFGLASQYGMTVDVHVDQNNDPDEYETELLARKTVEHGLQGRVLSVHSCSLAAKPDDYIDRIAKMLAEARVTVCICPRAMLDGVQMTWKTAPIHNSIAPVRKLLDNGVNIVLGVDNIHDLFCPFSDGDMMTELLFLIESTRLYDWDQLVAIAATNARELAKSTQMRVNVQS